MRSAVFSRREALPVMLAAIGATFGIPSLAFANGHILMADEALSMVKAGDLVLLDIRRPEEWEQTGVAEGAWPVSMHEADFGDRLVEILQQYRPDQIAFICRTGNRSDFLRSQIESQGLPGIRDVSEGMIGNGRAPGWLARGLPIVSAQEALASYGAAQAAWGQN